MSDDTHTFTVWDAARRDYLGGSTVAEICERHGIGRSAFYARAQAGGWRRRDTAHGPPVHDLIEPPDRPPQAARERETMAAEAMNRADQALRLGRLGEVKGWLKVVTELRRLAQEEAGVATWREALSDRMERDLADAQIEADWFEDEGWGKAEPAPVEAVDAEDAPSPEPRAGAAPDSPDTFSESGPDGFSALGEPRSDPAAEPIPAPRCGDNDGAIPI